MSKIIDGKQIAQKIKDDLKEKVKDLPVKPGLAVVLVGSDPASEIYVSSKEKACKEVGFYSKKIILPENTFQNDLNQIINGLNIDNKIPSCALDQIIDFPANNAQNPQNIQKRHHRISY